MPHFCHLAVITVTITSFVFPHLCCHLKRKSIRNTICFKVQISIKKKGHISFIFGPFRMFKHNLESLPYDLSNGSNLAIIAHLSASQSPKRFGHLFSSFISLLQSKRKESKQEKHKVEKCVIIATALCFLGSLCYCLCVEAHVSSTV